MAPYLKKLSLIFTKYFLSSVLCLQQTEDRVCSHAARLFRGHNTLNLQYVAPFLFFFFLSKYTATISLSKIMSRSRMYTQVLQDGPPCSGSLPNVYFSFMMGMQLYTFALRAAKALWSFGHSECNRVKP